jgi:hypothetical protein
MVKITMGDSHSVTKHGRFTITGQWHLLTDLEKHKYCNQETGGADHCPGAFGDRRTGRCRGAY